LSLRAAGIVFSGKWRGGRLPVVVAFADDFDWGAVRLLPETMVPGGARWAPVERRLRGCRHGIAEMPPGEEWAVALTKALGPGLS
jgi:hypothetical protein